MPRVALSKAQKMEYKILDFKLWVRSQMDRNHKTQEDVGKALGISRGRVSQMLKIPEPGEKCKKKKGEKLETDIFSYGQVLALCDFFGVDGYEKENLLTL